MGSLWNPSRTMQSVSTNPKSITSHRTVPRTTSHHPPLDPTSIEEFLQPAAVLSSSSTTITNSLSCSEPSLLLPSPCSANGLLPSEALASSSAAAAAISTSSTSHVDTLEQDWSLLAQPSPPQGTKRGSWTRRLVVTKQPSSEFYKDEGGKANSLDVEVTLVEFNELGEPARSPDDEFIDIPLRILLFFESGKRVDDTDQEIFRFVGNDYDSVVIRAQTRKASVQFRLEKVSRRKDGQRFKLRIEVDQEQCTANVADLTPIFTNAICVLSKRKHHGGSYSSSSNDTTMRIKEPPSKLLKRDLGRMEERFMEKMDLILSEITRMNRQLQKQNELLIKQQTAQLASTSSSSASTSLNFADAATFEWFFKAPGEDNAVPKPAALPSSSMMPYFAVSDDAYETETSSSDVSVLDIPHVSLGFADVMM